MGMMGAGAMTGFTSNSREIRCFCSGPKPADKVEPDDMAANAVRIARMPLVFKALQPDGVFRVLPDREILFVAETASPAPRKCGGGPSRDPIDESGLVDLSQIFADEATHLRIVGILRSEPDHLILGKVLAVEG